MSRYDIPGEATGSWGEFFASLEHMTTRLQSSKFTTYEAALSLITPLQTSVITSYNNAMAKLNTHVANDFNAHAVDRTMLQLGLVDNIGTATPQDILDGVTADLYITADGYSALATKVLGDFGNVLHHQGINPISVYGDISWLPPDIYGSFEGSGMLGSGNAGGFSMVEDDGTWIGLRSGTNGTSKGLYYFTLSNAEDRIDDVPPSRTNFRYSPPNRPQGFECLDTLTGSDSTVIVGKGYGHATYTGFVALTHGTMDVTAHNVGYFRFEDIFTYSEGDNYSSSACVVGDYVYLFVALAGEPGSNNGYATYPYDYKVLRCPTSQIIAGGAVSWERVTGWNSTGLWGNTGVADNVRIAPTISGTDPAAKPFLLHEGRTWTQTYSPVHSARRSWCAPNPTNANQVRLAIYHTIWTSLANGTAIMPSVAFSLLIDVAAKTAVVEDGATYVQHKSPNVNEVTLVSPIVLTDLTKCTGYDLGGNNWLNQLVTDRGYLLTRNTGNQPDENNVFMRAEITNFVSRFDALRMRNRVVRPITNVADNIRVGSAFSNNCFNPRILPGLYVMYQGSATDKPAQFWFGNAKRFQLTGSPTFNYNTLNSGVIKGWAPNSTRIEYPNNLTFNQGAFISRTSQGGAVVCDASVAWGPDTKGVSSSGTSIDRNLKISGSFSWNLTEGQNVALTAARAALGRNNIYNVAWTIYAAQDTNIPLIMLLTATSPRDDALGFHGVLALVELNHSGARSGLLTGYSFNRVVAKGLIDKVPGNVSCQYEANGALQVFKCTDGTYLMSIASPPVLGVYGSQESMIYFAAVRAGSKTIEDATVKMYNHSYFPNGGLPSGFVHPSYGLCMLDYATNNANYNAIMAINVMASSYADFTTWGVKNKLILGAQEVEKGWIVYFTSDTPVFLSGKEYIVPAGNIDLRNITADPANKTFYCYVRLGDTGIEYFITLEPLSPTMTMMYIGSISTGVSAITKIDVSKKIRVDTFELSPVHIGSGIPVGVGSPAQVGDFTGWIIPYLRSNVKTLKFAARLDYEGRFSVNLRTGVVSMSLTENGVESLSRPVVCYVTGTSWDPQMNSGTSGSNSTMLTRTATIQGLGVVDIDKASSWAVKIGNFVGRDASKITITQPSPANDYTATVSVIDGPSTGTNGESWDEYSFDLFVTIK